jgi:phage I-like protein
MAHIDMSLLSIECFMDDGKLDAQELDKLVSLAEKDGKITHEEKEVLKSVIKRIKPEEIDAAMQSRLDALIKKISM